MNRKVCESGRRMRFARYAIAAVAAAILLLIPVAAHALTPADPVRVCRALVDERPIKECSMAISGVPVDPLAAGACLRLQINYTVSMCMRTIAGMRYTPEEIAECDDLTNVWSTIKCFYTNGVRIAERNFAGSYADQICVRLANARQIEECVAAFQVGYVQPSAALACDRIKHAQQTVDCIGAIMNQQYSEAEVAACNSLATGPETIACFRREPLNAAPAQPMPMPQPMPPPPMWNRPPRPAPTASGGCNSYGCYQPGGGCNSYGCYPAGGGCNSYGCYGYGGGCNSYGCWKLEGGCNSYGCWRNGGGCNSYGCWHTRQGSCNSYGCTPNGACNSYGCPR